MNLLKKIFWVFVLFATVIKQSAATELEYKCSEIYEDNAPEVVITYNYGQLKYDNSKTTEELGEMYKSINAGQSAENINGLTSLEPQFTTRVSVDAAMLDEETFCLYPQRIEIKIWYNPTIYIINTLKPGTCRFNTTVRHEQTHLDLGHHALFLFAKSLREAESEILSSVSPVMEKAATADGDKIVKNMTDAYHEKVMVYFEKFKGNLKKYNDAIDTHENYIDETNLCKGE